jgi:hypothetical protein
MPGDPLLRLEYLLLLAQLLCHAPLLLRNLVDLNFDGFRVLPTDRRWLSLRIYLRIGHGVLETFSLFKCPTAWLYRLLETVRGGGAGDG